MQEIFSRIDRGGEGSLPQLDGQSKCVRDFKHHPLSPRKYQWFCGRLLPGDETPISSV